MYSPVKLKCAQEFILVTFYSYSALTILIDTAPQLVMYKT